VRCIGFNHSVIDFLRTTPSIETVVLSSLFFQYVTKVNYEHVIQQGDTFISFPASAANALSSLRRTVGEIRALGKRVVIIAPPPSSEFNIGGCLERQLSGTVAFGGRQGCVVDSAEYQSTRSEVLDFLNSIASEADVSIIRFDPWLCDSNSCATLLDDTMIYRDGGHLSYEGSKFLAKRMQLARLIHEQAK